jgi:hypothetical protein
MASRPILEVECTDRQAEKGCRTCGGKIIQRHWATLRWAAANWYCSRDCADVAESKVHVEPEPGEQ